MTTLGVRPPDRTQARKRDKANQATMRGPALHQETLDPKMLDEGCLLCSEDQPHQCHRRLGCRAEYLRQCWRNIEVVHLGEKR